MADTLIEFLLADSNREETMKVFPSDRFKEAGQPFEIRPLTSDEYSSIQERCTTVKKKGKTEFNQKKFYVSTILTGCLKPDFSDAEFIKKAGVSLPSDLIYKMLKPGEIDSLAKGIMELSGFNQDLEELEEEVKN